MINLVFVHGWSVTNTDTYGDMPEALASEAAAAGIELEVSHIHLGRYISFHDEVTVEDIARGFNKALIDTLPPTATDNIARFSCITHSTGGPVVRAWVERYYGAEDLEGLPLRHLIMLAPANHGSALAALGKKRIGRIKSWFAGVEPGQRILDWLSLGSDEQWSLAHRQLHYTSPEKGYFPFVIAGQTIDRKLYDFLNTYLKEKGSDGVVRVAACNMNYRSVTLRQSETQLAEGPETYTLEMDGNPRTAEESGLAVIPDASHSGDDIGIMRSVTVDNADDKPVVDIVLTCLKTQSVNDYETSKQAMQQVTEKTQADAEDISRYGMLVFQVQDDEGERLFDYDMLILGGEEYEPGDVPKGFFVDRQFNRKTGRLIYYVDADKLTEQMTMIGFRISARPDDGFSYYAAAEFRAGSLPVSSLIKANQTLYVNVVLRRRVAKNVFQLGPVSDKPMNFKKERPDESILDD